MIKAEFIQHEGKIQMHGVMSYRNGDHIERYDHGMLHSETHPAVYIRDDEGVGEFWYYKDEHYGKPIYAFTRNLVFVFFFKRTIFE